MGTKAYVGIDCSDLQLRTAYVVDSKSFSLPLPPEAMGPLIFFDPHANISDVGVGFPSVLSKIGSHLSFQAGQHTETPESLVKQDFSSVRQALLRVMAKDVGMTVLAVSANLRQTGRKTILDCAKAAGFNEVMLVDKCTAAALAHHRNREKTTALVFDVGYGDCEYSLLRLAKERCRVVASGMVPGVSGEMFDALVMEATILALRKQRMFLGLKQFSSSQWLEFRRIASNVRKALAEKPEVVVTFGSDSIGLDRPVKIRLRAKQFAAKVEPLVVRAIEGVRGMLEQNELEPANVDAFLVLGGTANVFPVFDLLATAFAGKPKRTDPNLVAMGAAWQASQAADQGVVVELPQFVEPTSFDEEGMDPTGRPLQASNQAIDKNGDSEAETQVAEVLELEPLSIQHRSSESTLSGELSGEVSLENARRLLEEGRLKEAGIILDAIAQGVDALRVRLQQNEAATVPRMMIHKAQALLNTGRFLEAVQLTHEAYTRAPGDPDVFMSMMRLHAEASLKLDRPEEYETAIRILKCAHGHDQTDRLIHKALAERHYAHAVAMRNLNNLSKALSITNLALSFDPKHPAANRLLDELTSGTPRQSSEQELENN